MNTDINPGTALRQRDSARGQALGLNDSGPNSRLEAATGDERLLQAVASEIASLAGPIAAAASVVNALAGMEPSCIREDALPPNIPMEPVVYPAVLNRLARADLPPELFAEIQHFHVRLGHARKAALAYCAGKEAPPLKGGVHLDVLAAAWRDLSAAAIKLLDFLAPATAAPGPSPWAVGAHPRCQELLASAAGGGWPCVMSDGSVEMPGIAERRRHARYPVSWSAGMLRGGEMLAIRIEDVSVGGVGVSSSAPVAINEQVIVELMGRMLSGNVSWRAARRFGIKLAVPLRVDDPIVVSARGN